MMIPMHSETPSRLTDDLMIWYAESKHGDTLYIPLPYLEWHIRLTRQRCGVTWRPPGQRNDIPVWLDQIVSWLIKIGVHNI